ncbi:MAG: hypothetical protein WCJ87_09905 [Burkholderiales bacterium]
MKTAFISPSLGLAATASKAALLVAAAAMSALGHAAPAASTIPASASPFPPSQNLLVWVGTGSASVFVDGVWQRAPSQDYEFSVTQRRYGERWESVKVQHRRHPDYDGSAGARDQVHYFKLELPVVSSTSGLSFNVRSSFGDGGGQIDREFRAGTMEFDARDVSMFAPFNRYRITQQYRYEQGELIEVIELFKKKGTMDTPFMRFEEQAGLFAPRRFDTAPDKR